MSVGNIFISYRRDDTEGHAGRLYDRLNMYFPGRVFMDVAGIDLGDDFVAAIERQVSACEVFIELIGKQWATITNQEGQRRLEQADDFVRLEVAAALRRSITIIPVLVHGATMPDGSTLPKDVAALTRHNALEITEPDFDHDVERLIDRLNAIFGGSSYSPSPKPTLSTTREPRFGRRLLMGLSVAGLLVISLIAITLFSVKTRFYTRPSSTSNKTRSVIDYVPSPGTVGFVNSSEGLDGELFKHYVDFSFYYPQTWQRDPNAGVPGASEFARVERRRTPSVVQEAFAVSSLSSAQSPDELRAQAEAANSELASRLSEYRKVSEGPTKAGVYDGYEFRFESIVRNPDKGDLKIWGREIFLPPVGGAKDEVKLILVATSAAQEVKSVEDVGVHGELPNILRSFRLGKTR